MTIHPQEIHYNQLLANENGMVISLRSSIQAKEHELTQIMDKLLHEKVNSAKAQEELAAVRARFQTAQHNMECLENKVIFATSIYTMLALLPF